MKSKYKQKLLEKQQEIDVFQINQIQLQKQCQDQYEQIEGLQRELEQVKDHNRGASLQLQNGVNQHQAMLQARHLAQNDHNMIGSFGNNNGQVNNENQQFFNNQENHIYQ